ncbi:NADP-binding protein [Dacryopinax primogenitus]|uniref:NADP-binding protein n=1 Tax=Dacryopinax primogenitus (strain DJM 731) TaxID=1858805 RepID=M5FUL6_DACPD|nr:NADP-binding protein [Dacryopinax primogenitus]EJU01451.1 NADP-binding protein [Dacryopinax primogenitus]
MATPPVVLVTGATGFIGSHTVLELIRRGYRVRGVSRSREKSEEWNALYPQQATYIEWVTISSIVDSDSLDRASIGVDYIIHTAAPFTLDFEYNLEDMLVPSVVGTRNIMRVASKRPRVKHVVIVSSLAAVVDYREGLNPERQYTPNDWAPASWEEAARTDDSTYVWTASKIFAERAAWDFLQQEKPQFFITTFCPPVILGPPGQPYDDFDELNQSLQQQWSIINGEAAAIPRAFFPASVDVRDVARLQVLALSTPRARNQRYIPISSPFTNGHAAAIVRRGFPDQARRVTPGPDDAPPRFQVDTSQLMRDFPIEWIPLERTLLDLAAALYQKESQLQESG